MASHKYHVGQSVTFTNFVRYAAAPGEYEIIQLLPFEGGEYQYRIKSKDEKYERCAGEDRLRLREASPVGG